MTVDVCQRKVVQEKWLTVSGPNAYCEACPWHLEASMSEPKDQRRVASSARFHARDTGHSVQLQRGQTTWLR